MGLGLGGALAACCGALGTARALGGARTGSISANAAAMLRGH